MSGLAGGKKVGPPGSRSQTSAEGAGRGISGSRRRGRIGVRKEMFAVREASERPPQVAWSPQALDTPDKWHYYSPMLLREPVAAT